jgi:hypothetical protein
MTIRIQGDFLSFLLQRGSAEPEPKWRDEITCDDPLPAIVETALDDRARATRLTDINHETTDDE